MALPKRRRYFLPHDPKIATAVLQLFLRVVEAPLKRSSPGAEGRARLGAVSFLHRFGSARSPHFHFHCAILDGVFTPSNPVQFHEATHLRPADIAHVEAAVRRRVLRLLVRRGRLEPEEAKEMPNWAHGGGFSVDASVRIEALDRTGLERLLRYWARPPFALERLSWDKNTPETLRYHLPKPLPDGRTVLYLSPLEWIDRLAALIPPPRVHRHRYHGVLAPHSPWRVQIICLQAAEAATDDPLLMNPPSGAEQPPTSPTQSHRSSTYLWARLLARIYACFPLLCPHCGIEMRIITFVTDTPSVRRILEHLGEPTPPPRTMPPRGPPLGAVPEDQTPALDPIEPEPAPEFEADQTLSW